MIACPVCLTLPSDTLRSEFLMDCRCGSLQFNPVEQVWSFGAERACEDWIQLQPDGTLLYAWVRSDRDQGSTPVRTEEAEQYVRTFVQLALTGLVMES